MTAGSRTAAGLVAAVAGFASYQHIYRVAIRAGEHRSVSAVLPLAIDGLILVATLAMLDDKRNQRRPRLSARVALVFGILATLAANVASAQPTLTARMVAAVPAVSFLLAVEVLARTGRPAADVMPSNTRQTNPPAVAYDYPALIGPEPAREPAVSRDESPDAPPTDSPDEPSPAQPQLAIAAEQPTGRRVVSESVREPTPAQRRAYGRLSKRLKREPSGEEFGAELGVSKATANRIKQRIKQTS